MFIPTLAAVGQSGLTLYLVEFSTFRPRCWTPHDRFVNDRTLGCDQTTSSPARVGWSRPEMATSSPSGPHRPVVRSVLASQSGGCNSEAAVRYGSVASKADASPGSEGECGRIQSINPSEHSKATDNETIAATFPSNVCDSVFSI